MIEKVKKINNFWMIILVFILSFVPLFIYSNLDTLVVNSIFLPYQKAGYLGYLPLFGWGIFFVNFIFAIATLPIIYKYKNNKKEDIFLIWLPIVSFLWIIPIILIMLLLFILSEFGLFSILGINESISTFVLFLLLAFIYLFLLLSLFISITKFKTKIFNKIVFSFIGGLVFALLSVFLGGVEFIGTWGGIPIFKMITIIAFIVIISQLLLFYAISYSKK